ncbi:uncharacterized protein NFIA_109600 [Aspergillus fischeri NRRL 181]|uniref:Uncharacterized protein n=1 Tax=Neosartorya fischeri (strain ATCC 1020 / DSM 3700 / CBS 544.65 / FGSC A1164 / JCM 1740 / NRRL 181 / WB 181) TaxID=331117 RepID=A1CXW4_NEOFI|nr:uncharacterized protein NFIA_109600 [Aspergillus fischeri NRRL 181]EAW25466.1 hypothetical protein NFIA_109600 [Aspergillus fischeri NRRL 181]
MELKAHLSLLLVLLLAVAIACAAPIRRPISALHSRQDPGPGPEAEAEAEAEALDSLLPSPLDLPLPKPEPLDVDSMLANSPLSDFYKMIKEEVKIDLPNMRHKNRPV